MKKIIVFAMASLTLAIIFGCALPNNDLPEEPQYENFNSPEDILDNPVVIQALDETGFEYTTVKESPGSPQEIDSIEGVYAATGQITDSDVSRIIGLDFSSEILLFNQTSNGEINYMERIGDTISLGANGSFIRGSGTSFTIYLEAKNTIDGVTIYNVAMISGNILLNGNINAKVLTTNIRKENDEGYLIPNWYTSDITLTLKPVPTPRDFSVTPLHVEGSDMLVRFNWEPVDSTTITGYQLYRNNIPREFLNNTHAEGWTYEPRGETYSYYVKAIGLDGQTESNASNTVTITIP